MYLCGDEEDYLTFFKEEMKAIEMGGLHIV